MGRRLIDDILEWMTKYKKSSVKQATYDRLETSFKLMELYPIANILTDVLTEDDVQDYVNALTADGYSLSTIKKQFNLISGFIRFANTKGIFPRPIYNNVNLPAQSVVLKPKRDVIAYDISEQERLRRVLESAERPGYFAALLMMETGLRIGECLALTWRDISWTRRSVSVNKTFVRLGNCSKQFIQNEAKSYSSNRTVPLNQKALGYLTDLRKRNPDGSGFIFYGDHGMPLSYEAMRFQISKACEKAGVPYYGQHVFRHTFATNCYNRGCDVKILSKLLGHSNVTITYNVYIHLFGDALEEMRKVVG